MEQKTLFDYLNAINYKKSIPYDKRIASAYLLSLWLSHANDLLETVNDINKFLFLLPDEVIYKYFYFQVPKGKRFIKWVKKDKDVDSVIEKIRKEHHLSKKEAEKYKLLFTSQQ